jgi:hypothetical protein
MQLASYMDRLLTVREGMIVPFIPAPVSY